MLSVMATTYAGRVWQGFLTGLGVASPWRNTEALSDVVLNDLYPDAEGDLADIVPVSRALALTVPAIVKCRNTLVYAFSGLPLEINGKPHQLDDGRPNVISMAILLDALYFHGFAWFYARQLDDAGRPAPGKLRVVDPAAVELDDDGRPVKLDGRPASPERFYLLEGLTEGILSPSTGLTIRRARAAENAAGRAMENPVPSVELHQTTGDPLPATERNSLIAGWLNARRGKNGGVAYTTPNIETKIHGQAAEQLLINGRNATALDCARISGMPAWVVDASVEGSSLTYSNVPSRSRELLDYCARGYLDAIAGRLAMDDLTPHGQAARFELGRLLRGDFRDRMESGKVAIDAGIYTAEDIRAMDNDTPGAKI